MNRQNWLRFNRLLLQGLDGNEYDKMPLGEDVEVFFTHLKFVAFNAHCHGIGMPFVVSCELEWMV